MGVHSWLGGNSCEMSQRFMETSSFYNLGVWGCECEPPAVKQEETHFQPYLTLQQASKQQEKSPSASTTKTIVYI